MWRNQNSSTSLDSSLDSDRSRGRSATDCWKPPYVGRCLPECDLSQSKYQYPLTAVRPDYVALHPVAKRLPGPPELPYSKNTPPHWMKSHNPEKYFIKGYDGNRFFTFPQFGHSSKVDTQSALCDFTNNYQFTKSYEWQPLPFYHASLHGERSGNDIYPRRTGMIPSYKGHVPGLQHSYGRTFGHESVNAKRHLNDSPCCQH